MRFNSSRPGSTGSGVEPGAGGIAESLTSCPVFGLMGGFEFAAHLLDHLFEVFNRGQLLAKRRR